MDSAYLIQMLRQFVFACASYGHIVFLGTLGITVIGLGPIGRAMASRIRGGRALEPNDPALREVKTELSELQGRLDFSERVLLEVRQRLIGGVPPDDHAK